ncbi:MAG: hypothetical protein FJW36_10080 [Acidobacteria bacterium]|nr:hypothetical protein [Acidobacteriota bacterium]
MNFRLHNLLVCALACTLSLFSQTSGRISGTVTDPSGSSIPGAAVELFLAGGTTPVIKAETNANGDFVMAGVRPETYFLQVSSKGFRTSIIRNLKVDTSAELALKIIKLELSATAETIEVSAESAVVQTASAEVSTTVTNAQLRLLPSLNRSPLGLLQTQAGVTSNARTNTTINGLRPSFSNITLDGINIQDNFIRTNTLDYQPNLLLLDQVAEATLVTSNSNPALGNGAAQINLTTPSGTNQFHGSAVWLNRNNIASANTWFNNRNGVKRPFLNQNQFGGSIGGPIKKDKLFFYTNYEALRTRQQASATRALLRADARRGIMTYRDSGGALRQVNVLTAANLTADPRAAQIISAVPGAEAINRSDVGDGLNTGGITFNIRNNRTRDNVLGKVDYILSSKHAFAGTYTWNRDILDRPDLMNNFVTTPTVTNSGATKLLSLSHRWSPSATLTNELRGGYNLAPAPFNTSDDFSSPIIAPTLVNNPVNTFRRQGRNTNTYNLQNNATWSKGRHTLQFGFQSQFIRVESFNDAGITATYGMGISAANPININAALPGISAADLGTANALLSLHAGLIANSNLTFNVKDRQSGFLPNQANVRNFTNDNYALYFQDKWKASRRLSITAGLRWDYFTPVDESNGLALLPLLNGQSAIAALLNPVGTLDFAGRAVGRNWYKKDFNNFAPNIGVAYDIFGDGKTSFRAGYSVNFANDEFVRSTDNSIATNAGLQQGVTNNNLVARASSLPPVATPTFRVPRTYADNYAVNSQAAIGIPDPSLVTPYVQQWSAGIQREIAKGIIEVRYVGNRGTKQFRAFDYNQVRIDIPGYREDFERARRNGELARAATGTFNPLFNASIPGSQPTPFFNSLPSQGLLANATIRGIIERGELGELGNTYQINGLNGAVNFYRNQNALGTNMMTNYSNASYHGLQIDYTRRYARGFYFQANYVWSKNLSDAAGDAQARFEPFLDINNAAIEYSRTPFDLRQQFKLNSAWDIPIGKGHKLDAGKYGNFIVGGWTLSTFVTVNSGSPFSLTSGRGTLNRAGRSGLNTVNTNLTVPQLESLMRLRIEGDGPYYFAPALIASDTRGTALEGRTPAANQAFFNPGVGQLGSLGRRVFDGPIFKNADIAIQKRFDVREKQYMDFRAEMFNFTNSVSFDVPGYGINGTNFGRITGTQSGRRVMQFSLYYRF